jgi:hypothetical protein
MFAARPAATKVPAQGLQVQVPAETTPAEVLLGRVRRCGMGVVALEGAVRVSV